MILSDLLKLKSDGDSFLSDKEIKEIEQLVSINKVVPLSITASHSFDRSNDIEVKLLAGQKIGKLKFLKGKEISDIFSLPDEEYICFLSEYNKSSIVDSQYQFANDFLLLEEASLSDYLTKYKKSSPIWGSFFHVEDKPRIEFINKVSITSIEAVEGITISNKVYLENLLLAVNEPNPINRFLKLYHLLELQFDLHTAVRIRDLLNQGGKEREISSKLRDYTKDEDERLESLIKERCTNLSRIVPHLNQISHFPTEAVTIFYDYGKARNPLKRPDFNNVVASVDKFAKNYVDSIGGYAYESLIPKLTSYWIYRIRCCAAHNRFGEYILTVHDEKFIVEFAEPLIKEAIIQCFKT